MDVAPGETATLLHATGAGCIQHIWLTMDEIPRGGGQEALRQAVLRMFWDGEPTPSVQTPAGDFFGMGHGISRNFSCAPLAMSPEDGKGFTCYFAMPFSREARVELLNESVRRLRLYYYVDYEMYESLADRYLRFHACWRRENPCQGVDDGAMTNEQYAFGGRNTSGKGNYLILDAEGQGHYVGCHLDIHNLRTTRS